MEVKMNKEIRDYQESMFFGLNFRQCAFSVLAILAALGTYFVTRRIAVDEIRGWLCMAAAVPFAACGFFKYHGMTAEQFLIAFLKSELLYPRKLLFKSENLYYACLEDVIRTGEKTGKDGTEIVKRKAERQKRPVKKKGRRDALD